MQLSDEERRALIASLRAEGRAGGQPRMPELRAGPPPSTLRENLEAIATKIASALGSGSYSGTRAEQVVNAAGSVIPPLGIYMGVEDGARQLARVLRGHGDASSLAPYLLAAAPMSARVRHQRAFMRKAEETPVAQNVELNKLYPGGAPTRMPGEAASTSPSQVFNNKTNAERAAEMIRKELPPQWEPIIKESGGGSVYLTLMKKPGPNENFDPHVTTFKARFSDHAPNDARVHISSDPASRNGPEDVLAAAKYFAGLSREPPTIGWSTQDKATQAQHAGRGIYYGRYEKELPPVERLKITERFFGVAPPAALLAAAIKEAGAEQ